MGDDTIPPCEGSIREELRHLKLKPQEERHSSPEQTRSSFTSMGNVYTERCVILTALSQRSLLLTRIKGVSFSCAAMSGFVGPEL